MKETRCVTVSIPAFTAFDVAIWFGLAVAQFVDTARHGGRKTLEDILAEKNPIWMARLLRYHLGWPPGRIAAEVNPREIFNRGMPWHEDDVSRIIEGVRIESAFRANLTG